MGKKNAIAILDIGKTNKKVLLFDEDYNLVFEQSARLQEITDEDGDPCEDVEALMNWASNAVEGLMDQPAYKVSALNFSAYGASWVFIDNEGKVIAPLYNYLKPFPGKISRKIGDDNGLDKVCTSTRSPYLGSLNAGLQLLRMKEMNPSKWQSVEHALSLPQFIAWYFTKNPVSEISSIGCHTMLWDFNKYRYASWAENEGLTRKLPPMEKATAVIGNYKGIPTGGGMHDSSAAIIPYLLTFNHPFLLLSTGTWNICLNPFAEKDLRAEDLDQDCLSYLSYEGKAVWASRLFAGDYHEKSVRQLADHFGVTESFYKEVEFDGDWIPPVNFVQGLEKSPADMLKKLNCHGFSDLRPAYHALIFQLVQAQKRSIQLAMAGQDIKQIYVDGGFGNNTIFMQMLAKEFPQQHLFAATVPQATALGAALVMHRHWNSKPIPANLVKLKKYAVGKQ